MKPQEELEYLKNFIQLTEEQATKRDMLEHFLKERDKVVRLDADSIAYNVASYVIKNGNEQNLDVMYDDFHTQVRSIVNAIEEDGINVIDIYYYFTTCKNNFRKLLCEDYKANRTIDPTKELARDLVGYCIHKLNEESSYADHSDTLEADDLISIHAKEYGHEDYITASIDKDLRQILGAHFDYFKVKTGDLDVWNEPIKEYRGWSFSTEKESLDMFLKQMLVGDSVDGVKGIKGIGKVKAARLLDGKSDFVKLLEVARAYDDNERFRKNIKLMRL